MSEKTYTLEAILAAISRCKKRGAVHAVTKRTLFTHAPLGGMSSTKLILFFFSLPFIEFALLFNPYVFSKLGIAQSIIFYIVFMSIMMMIIFTLSWKNNKSAFNKISDSWSHYFPDIDLKMVLSSGVTPYSEFFPRYSAMADKKLSEEDLYKSLRLSFDEMKEENRDLLEAIERDRSR